MMRSSRLAWVVAGGALCFAPSAFAGCASFHASDIYLTYDPLGTEAAGQVIRPITLSVARSPSSDASSSTVAAQFVDFDSIQVFHVGLNGPVYSIYGDQQVLVDRSAPPLRTNQVFTHDLPAGQAVGESVHGLQLILDGGQDIAAGTYEERLDIQYSCQAVPQNSDISIQSAALRILVNVPNKIVANLAGGSTAGSIDFGDFSSLNKFATINVYSTGPYALQIDSANNGAMKIEGAETSDESGLVDYSLAFRGQSVEPGRSYTFGRSGVSGESSIFSVTAAPIAGKRSGIYHDTLTLTFTPMAL